MENKKVISIRLTPSMVEEIEQCVRRQSDFWKRQDFIEKAINLAIAAEKAGLMRQMMAFNPKFGDVVDKFEFRYHRERK